MSIAHWRRASAADQTPKAEHPTYRELDPEEMTKVSAHHYLSKLEAQNCL
jgi:hypothetical protein